LKPWLFDRLSPAHKERHQLEALAFEELGAEGKVQCEGSHDQQRDDDKQGEISVFEQSECPQAKRIDNRCFLSLGWRWRVRQCQIEQRCEKSCDGATIEWDQGAVDFAVE
jgi:hypothetical protein